MYGEEIYTTEVALEAHIYGCYGGFYGNYMYMNRGVGFANARDVRNMFEQVYASQSTRLANTPHTEAELSVIEAIDLKGI